MRNLRMSVATATAGVLVLAVSACGGEQEDAEVVSGGWDEIVAAAEDEGTVSFYSVAPEVQNARMEKAFEEKYPNIDLKITRGATELPSRVAAEIQSGSKGADAFLYSDTAWFADFEDQLLEAQGPSVEGWHDDAWGVEGKSPVAYTGPFSLFVWNTKKFPEGFQDWQDFLDPSVKGELALRESVSPSMAGHLKFMEDEFGPEYIEGLADQDPKFYPSTVPLAQAIGSGEVGATVINNISNVKDLVDTGAPVDYAVPEPSYAIQWGMGAFDTAAHPNGALVILDFVMSEEGQTALNGDGFGAAGRDIEGDLDLGADTTILDSTEYTPDVIAQWEAKFTDYFNRSAG